MFAIGVFFVAVSCSFRVLCCFACLVYTCCAAFHLRFMCVWFVVSFCVWIQFFVFCIFVGSSTMLMISTDLFNYRACEPILKRGGAINAWFH